jgi:hypothetical protein
VDHYPATRFGDSTRYLDDPRLVASDAHNWAYCMLKHLPPLRKALFLAYALLVGSGNRIGLAKYLGRVWRSPARATAQLIASWRGLMAGVRSYRSRVRRAPQQPMEQAGGGARP